MKKILILIFMFFLTGCTVNYNLDIFNNRISENISGSMIKSEYEPPENVTSTYIQEEIAKKDQYPLIDGSDIYDKKVTNNSDGIDLEFNYVYRNNYDKSRILNSCFENVTVEDKENYLYISLTGEFYCQYADKINVNVKTDYSVIESNGKQTNNDTYNWTINGNNANIIMKIAKVKRSNKVVDKEPNYFRIIGFGVLIVLSTITYILYRKKNSGTN